MTRLCSSPSTRALLTAIFESLGTGYRDPETAKKDTPPRLNPATSPAFLTLHCIYPDQLLPALDLLDRRLVAKLLVPFNPSDTSPSDPAPLYYVSTSTRPKKRRHHDQPNTHFAAQARTARYDEAPTSLRRYEVRLGSWTCSCAPFAMTAFGADETPNVTVLGGIEVGEGGDLRSAKRATLTTERSAEGRQGRFSEQSESRGLRVGGASRGEQVPAVCKHLLACMLAESSTEIAQLVSVVRVESEEELVGWTTEYGGR